MIALSPHPDNLTMLPKGLRSFCMLNDVKGGLTVAPIRTKIRSWPIRWMFIVPLLPILCLQVRDFELVFDVQRQHHCF
jgi:hypothetical protein